MKDHDGCIRGFHHRSKAWYARYMDLGRTDEISIGLYHRGGGTSGEFQIVWIELAGRSVPQLCAFSDGWHALASQFGDLLQWLASVDSEDPSPDVVAAKLCELGVVDMTARKSQIVTAADVEYASWLTELTA